MDSHLNHYALGFKPEIATPNKNIAFGPPVEPIPDASEAKTLAHILWRVAKQLVSLLEKEYGFGQVQGRGNSVVGHKAGHRVTGPGFGTCYGPHSVTTPNDEAQSQHMGL